MDINVQKDREISILESEVATLRDKFISEIEHTDRPGLGPEAFSILRNIEVKCRVNPDSYFNHGVLNICNKGNENICQFSLLPMILYGLHYL